MYYPLGALFHRVINKICVVKCEICLVQVQVLQVLPFHLVNLTIAKPKWPYLTKRSRPPAITLTIVIVSLTPHIVFTLTMYRWCRHRKVSKCQSSAHRLLLAQTMEELRHNKEFEEEEEGGVERDVLGRVKREYFMRMHLFWKINSRLVSNCPRTSPPS